MNIEPNRCVPQLRFAGERTLVRDTSPSERTRRDCGTADQKLNVPHTLGGITVPFGKSWRQPDRLAGPPPKTDRFAFTIATPLPQPISELASDGQITVPPL